MGLLLFKSSLRPEKGKKFYLDPECEVKKRGTEGKREEGKKKKRGG